MRILGATVLLAVACRPAPAPAPAPAPVAPAEPAAPAEPVPATPIVAEAPDLPPPEPERPPPRFTPGDPAPAGLDPAGIREFARDQGDPLGGAFDLQQAFLGDPGLESRVGTLFAIIDTDKGAIECELFERSAPKTVANFVGLARGVRPFQDEKSGAWITGRFYDGTIFHRVIDSFMIQGGDRSGTGRGRIGYVLPDEIDGALAFDAAGVLAMANRGRGTADSQFFITVAAAPHLAGSHTIFGKCDPKVPIAISRVPVDLRDNHRPKTDVMIRRVEIERRR